MRIGIIGAGNMGGAIYERVAARMPEHSLVVCEKNQDKIAALRPVPPTAAVENLIASSDIVILAIKPQSFYEWRERGIPSLADKLVISVMAGVSIAEIQKATGAAAVARAMPNLAAKIGQSVTGWICSGEVSAEQKTMAQKIFSALGAEVEVEREEIIDDITALFGSGPAYFYYLAELLAEKARERGMADGEALAKQTLTGAAAVLEQSGKTSAAMRAAVTSKGGTTEAALAVLGAGDFKKIFFQAIDAAREKAVVIASAGGFGVKQCCRDVMLSEVPTESGRAKHPLATGGSFAYAQDDIRDIFSKLSFAKRASRELAQITDEVKNKVLCEIAFEIRKNKNAILAENKKDTARMDPADPKYKRLELDDEKIENIAAGLEAVSRLSSPLDVILEERTLASGLKLQRKTVPFGVIGIIYEARPNVTPDVFSLCFKSGNACVLKGGSDAVFSHRIFVAIIHSVLEKFGVDKNCVALLPEGREAVGELLTAHGLVDVIIPRGGQGLINFVRENSKLPVIETGAGVVHTYFDAGADLAMGQKIIENGKVNRPAVCNALDTLIINSAELKNLAELVKPLALHRVELFADERALAALHKSPLEGGEGGVVYPASLLHPAAPSDFGREFLSLKMSIKTVDNIEQAIEHINTYGSGHSEAIISRDEKNIQKFLDEVDAAAVYANAPTVFTDGGEFGLGAEIGISTQKLHARGPMGLAALTSYKWILRGEGQVRE